VALVSLTELPRSELQKLLHGAALPKIVRVAAERRLVAGATP